MKRSHIGRLFAAGGALAIVLAFCALQRPAPAQVNSGAITTPIISSTSASGVSGVLALDGKFPNCVVYAQTSTSTATIVANGNTQTAAYGQSSAYVQVGTNITATTTMTATQENMASAPVGFFFTWSGNSGTLTAWATCSQANSTVFSGTVTANVPTPLPVTQSSVPWSMQCTSAANCPVSFPQATASPNGGAATPFLQVAPCANNAGTTNCAGVTAGQNLQVVQNAAPSATTPVSTPSAAPAATATAGAALPSQAVNVNAYEHCTVVAGTAVTTGNAIVVRCNNGGLLLASEADPTAILTTTASISSATTTAINTPPPAGISLYVYAAGFTSNGTNSANTVQLVYGTGVSCVTGQQNITPVAYAPGTTTGETAYFWGGSASNTAFTQADIVPSNIPFFVPAANGVCVKTAGTTTAGVAWDYTVSH